MHYDLHKRRNVRRIAMNGGWQMPLEKRKNMINEFLISFGNLCSLINIVIIRKHTSERQTKGKNVFQKYFYRYDVTNGSDSIRRRYISRTETLLVYAELLRLVNI